MRFAPLLIALAAGCGPSVHGKVGDAHVHASTAYFAEQAGAFPDGDLLRVWLSDASCADQAAWLAAIDDATTPQTQADAWSSTHPRDFWQFVVEIRTGDPAALEGTDLVGVASDGSLGQPGMIRADIVHYLSPLDVAYWDGADQAGYTDRYVTDSGAGTVDRYVPGQRLSGSFDADVVGLDTTPAGTVRLSYDAEICEDLGVGG